MPTVHTQAFTHDEVEFLATLLRNRFQIPVTTREDEGHWVIYFGPDARTRLLQVIREYQLPGMAYKYAPLPKARKIIHGATAEERKAYWREYNRQYMRQKRAHLKQQKRQSAKPKK